MTEREKQIMKRFSLVLAILTAVACLICLIIFPPGAVILLLGGIGIWLICIIFMIICSYIFK